MVTPDPPGTSRPTLRQVAEVAGVSIKTVSRALRGEGYVATETSVKVHDAARQVGFRLNALASELRRGSRSTLVGLVTADLANPFYAQVAGGVERVLRSRGLQLITASTDENASTELDLVDALLQRRVQALLIASASTDHSHLADEAGRGIPLVFVDRPPIGIRADTVLIDNHAGAVQAIEHLIAGGHSRIGVIADLSRLATAQARVDGVTTAMAAAGIADWQRRFVQDAHDADSAQAAVTALLDTQEPPTALLTLNNRITAGALHAFGPAHPGSRQSPALIGFDDFELSDVLGVSVIGYDTAALGRVAATLAMERLDDPELPARTLVIPTTLIARGSGERPATS